MNSGYNGFSMSNRAVEAYEDGEKPLSKWRKKDIIEGIQDLSIDFNIELLKKVKVKMLKDKMLYRSSWHHTSSYCNETNFYSLDIRYIENLTNEDIEKMILEDVKEDKQEETKRRLANFEYLEWGGSRRHPRATEHILKNVYVEEKGCFYHVYNEKGEFILKKKINSNGTYCFYIN